MPYTCILCIQTLPVNYAGFSIILTIILFILEIKIISWRLTIGGVIAMLLGSQCYLNHRGLYETVVVSDSSCRNCNGSVFTVVVGLAYRAYKRKPVTGSEGCRWMELQMQI